MNTGLNRCNSISVFAYIYQSIVSLFVMLINLESANCISTAILCDPSHKEPLIERTDSENLIQPFFFWLFSRHYRYKRHTVWVVSSIDIFIWLTEQYFIHLYRSSSVTLNFGLAQEQWHQLTWFFADIPIMVMALSLNLLCSIGLALISLQPISMRTLIGTFVINL